MVHYFAKLLLVMRLTATSAWFLSFILLPCISVRVFGQSQVSQKVEANKATTSPTYRVGGDVTAPKAIYSPEPEFSEAARKAGYSGTCVLSAIVGSDGRPSDIHVVRKLGMQLDEQAIHALREWKFEPARKSGTPVAVSIQVEFSFHLDRDGATRQIFSAEQYEQMKEAQSRIQNQIYRIPVGDEPSACSTSPSDRHGPVATVAELRLQGDLRRSRVDSDRIEASIKQQTYYGSEGQIASEVSERVQRAWQNAGYFAVRANAEGHVLTSGPSSERVSVIVQIDEGQQYRLEEIRFRNNKAITNVQRLRNLFSIKDGDIFNRDAIEEGLQNLHRAYGEYGYINISSVPTTRIHEEQRSVSLDIDLDEGKRFLISRIDVVGLDEATTSLMELFQLRYSSRLPAHESLEPRYKLHLDENGLGLGRLSITYDFRHCQTN